MYIDVTQNKSSASNPPLDAGGNASLHAGSNPSESVLQGTSKDKTVLKFRVTRKYNFKGEECDKILTRGILSPRTEKERNTCAIRFSDREDFADWAEHFAEARRVEAWKTAQIYLQNRSNTSRPTFSAEDRACIIDSGAPLHMMGRTSLTREEMTTVKKASVACVSMIANGTVEANHDPAVYMMDLDIFVCVKLVEDSPAVPSLGMSGETVGQSGRTHVIVTMRSHIRMSIGKTTSQSSPCPSTKATPGGNS